MKILPLGAELFVTDERTDGPIYSRIWQS